MDYIIKGFDPNPRQRSKKGVARARSKTQTRLRSRKRSPRLFDAKTESERSEPVTQIR